MVEERFLQRLLESDSAPLIKDKSWLDSSHFVEFEADSLTAQGERAVR